MTEKRIMLSFPMAGKTREEIENTKNLMIEWLFDKYNDDCIVIESIIEDHESKSALECFIESRSHMSTVDTVCMGKEWENARGCRLEHEIAKEYGLNIIYYGDIDD